MQDSEPPRMTFEGEESQILVRNFATEKSKFVQFVIAHSGGLIKSETHANYILIGFAVVMFGISLFVAFGGESETASSLQKYKNKPQFLPQNQL